MNPHLQIIYQDTAIDIHDCNDCFKFITTPIDDDISTSDTDMILLDELPNHLTSHQIHIIDSVKSGNRSSTKKIYSDILQPLLTVLKIPHVYYPTTCSNSIKAYGKKLLSLNSKQPFLILFISGDTSISEFINSLTPSINSHSNLHLTILPFSQGTGNSLCNSIGLTDPLESIKSLLNGSKYSLPIYRAVFSNPAKYINGVDVNNDGSDGDNDDNNNNVNYITSTFFVIVASWCLHSSLIFESDKPEMREKYGSKRFVVAAETILKENPRYRGNYLLKPVSSDFSTDTNNNSDATNNNEPSWKDFSYFVVVATPKLEADFTISPDSEISSNQLHIISIPYIDNSNEIMDIMMKGYDNGKHIFDKRVDYVTVPRNDEILLRLHDSVPDYLSNICIDGSILRMKGKNRSVIFENFSQNNLFYLL